MDMKSRIKSMRLELGLTQEELGQKLGVNKQAVNKWEKGTVVNIKRSTIDAMAKIFDVSPLWLMGFSVDRDGNADFNQLYGIKQESNELKQEMKTVTYSRPEELIDAYMEEEDLSIIKLGEKIYSKDTVNFIQYQDLLRAISSLKASETLLLYNALTNNYEKSLLFAYLQFLEENTIPKYQSPKEPKNVNLNDKILPQAERNTQQMNNRETIKKE